MDTFDKNPICRRGLFNQAHLVASEYKPEGRRQCIKDIDHIGKLGAEIVIPGHQRPGMQFDTSSLDFTRKYLRATDEDLTGIPSAAEFHSAMIKRFPKANLVYFLDMNARVLNNDWNWREEP